jgi:periplasmic mercuric ion binding protein
VPGVIETKVDYDHKAATVKYDPDKTTPAALVDATTNAGFPSSLHGGEKK